MFNESGKNDGQSENLTPTEIEAKKLAEKKNNEERKEKNAQLLAKLRQKAKEQKLDRNLGGGDPIDLQFQESTQKKAREIKANKKLSDQQYIDETLQRIDLGYFGDPVDYARFIPKSAFDEDEPTDQANTLNNNVSLEDNTANWLNSMPTADKSVQTNEINDLKENSVSEYRNDPKNDLDTNPPGLGNPQRSNGL